jgi:AhpC/TSA family
MHIKLVCAAIATCLVAAVSLAAEQNRKTVVYDGVATEVSVSPEASNDLWVMLKDLTRATRFVVKPQGVCRDELCFPIPKGKTGSFVSKKGSENWFNLSEFARLVKQPVARDEKNGVWYFGKREDERGTYLASLEAPNFTLADMAGRSHSLSDYRGKKVLLITWASW